jgi:hypothetical protein
VAPPVAVGPPKPLARPCAPSHHKQAFDVNEPPARLMAVDGLAERRQRLSQPRGPLRTSCLAGWAASVRLSSRWCGTSFASLLKIGAGCSVQVCGGDCH